MTHSHVLSLQANAQPRADAASEQVDAAAASVEQNVPELAEKAAQDITDVAFAVGNASRRVAADVSKTVENVAKDIEVRNWQQAFHLILLIGRCPESESEACAEVCAAACRGYGQTFTHHSASS